MQEEIKCKICKDSLHIVEDGLIKRCSCLKSIAIERKLIEAGISIPPDRLDYRYIFNNYKSSISKTALEVAQACSSVFKKKQFPKFSICFTGPSPGAKDILSSIMIKDAILSGYHCCCTTIEDLIHSHFNENMNLTRKFRAFDVFRVEFGSELSPDAASHFIRELIRISSNSSSYLFFSTFLKQEDIFRRYGDETGRQFIAKVKILSAEVSS